MRLLIILARLLFHNRIRQFHIFAFLRYPSFRKVLNFFANTRERLGKKLFIRSKPYLLYLEATSRCNFNCPFCPTGKHYGRPGGILALSTLEKILDEIGDSVYLATLHGWGEPLLHPRLDELIRTLHKRRIYSLISTNASLLSRDTAEKLIASGLDYLIVAIDGISSETYEKYRAGGRIDRVLENVRNFIKIRNSMKRRTPYVEWQFVVFKHNEGEINEARALARKIGVDKIEFIPGFVENLNYKIDKTRFKSRSSPLSSPHECKSLWSIATILWDGNVAACCWDYYGDTGFGNVNKNSFMDIWNNEKFRVSRLLIRDGLKDYGVKTICSVCIGNIERQSPNISVHDQKEKDSGANKP